MKRAPCSDSRARTTRTSKAALFFAGTLQPLTAEIIVTVPKLKVVAMPTGWLTVDRSSQVYGRYFGQQIKVPVWSTAIVGGDKKIVVDTGIHDPAWVSSFVCPCEQAPEERLERALKEYVGWSAAA